MAKEILSDKSVKNKKISRVARKVSFRDLDLTLKLHPIRKDIVPLKDDNAAMFSHDQHVFNWQTNAFVLIS